MAKSFFTETHIIIVIVVLILLTIVYLLSLNLKEGLTPATATATAPTATATPTVNITYSPSSSPMSKSIIQELTQKFGGLTNSNQCTLGGSDYDDCMLYFAVKQQNDRVDLENQVDICANSLAPNYDPNNFINVNDPSNVQLNYNLLGEGQTLNPKTVSNNNIQQYNIPGYWYQPGSFAYNSNFKENTDSIYNSSTTNTSLVSPITSAPYLQGGFCQQYVNDTIKKNAMCNSLPSNVCASTDCCVLLGGQTCVAGNEQGPLVESAYSNFLVQNRDMYYYKGKCYGNCNPPLF